MRALDAGDHVLDRLGHLRFELGGAAPNCVIVTETTGTSTFGSCVIGSLLKVRIPSATSAAETTMGGSGCRIDHPEILTAISVLRPVAGQ